MTGNWKDGKTPDYDSILTKRKDSFLRIYKDPTLISGSKIYYKDKPVDFINDWGCLYEPRNAGSNKLTLMPFVLFKRQIEFIEFIYGCYKEEENGAIEKCRDVGATWCAVAFSVWAWQYHSGVAVGWGSRKEILVDKIGDPDSIFQKIRIFIKNLPSFCKPAGFIERDHATYMKVINPATGSTVTGESGDNIGRGGRKKIYFKDESAHYERPESIEAALGDNTNVQIDISSVNGPDTVFQRKIETGIEWESGKTIPSGETRTFIFDWRDHPGKTQEWHDKRRAKAEREGLLHIFLQEVDRDTSASIDGIVIKPEWIKSAIDAHVKLGIKIEGQTYGALDVADEGVDNHSLSIRMGILLKLCKEWFKDDVGEATQKSLFHCKKNKAGVFLYDSIGVGAGVKSETNRLKREGLLPDSELKVLPWNAASKVLFPNKRVVKGDKDSPLNKDFFANLKAQAWWDAARRFEKTYKAITEDKVYDPDELISIDSKITEIHQIVKQLSQATYSINGVGKVVINKQPKGTKSPNKADSIIMSYWPPNQSKVFI